MIGMDKREYDHAVLNFEAYLRSVSVQQTDEHVYTREIINNIIWTFNRAFPRDGGAMYLCKGCGAPLVERMNRKTKQYFWGCSMYTKTGCKGKSKPEEQDAIKSTIVRFNLEE